MNDGEYEIAFQLITNAGNSKSASLMAVEAAREFNFEEAEKYLEEAEKELRKAHQAQTELIQRESKGERVNVNIILVHSQDHLTMALLSKTQAEEFINLYKNFKNMKELFMKTFVK